MQPVNTSDAKEKSMSHHRVSTQAFHELDDTSLRYVVGGQPWFDQLVSEFPVWLLPYIDIAHIDRVAQVFRAT